MNVFLALVYSAESWILNISLLKQLEFFQASEFSVYLNYLLTILFAWPCNGPPSEPTPYALSFLQTITKGVDSLSSKVFRTLAMSDVESLLLVKQCQFLESV